MKQDDDYEKFLLIFICVNGEPGSYVYDINSFEHGLDVFIFLPPTKQVEM